MLLTLAALAAGCVDGADGRFGEAKRLIATHCAACHRVPGVAAAQGRVGPSLDGIGSQQLIAGYFPNTPRTMVAWIRYPQRLLPRNGMPDTGLSDPQARAVAAYLYTLN